MNHIWSTLVERAPIGGLLEAAPRPRWEIDPRADGVLGFRTGVQAAGNTCLLSGTEPSGMVLLWPFLLSTHQYSTHDSTGPARGRERHLNSHSLGLYMVAGREEIRVLVGRRKDAGAQNNLSQCPLWRLINEHNVLKGPVPGPK